MNDSYSSDKSGDSRAAAATVLGESPKSGGARLYAIKSSASKRPFPGKAAVSSYVTISVDAEGWLSYDSDIDREDAERVVDALLLMLVKARQASS